MGIISIDTEGLKKIVSTLGKVVNDSIGSLPDVIENINQVVNEYGDSLDVINQNSSSSENQAISQTLTNMQSIVGTVSNLVKEISNVAENFEDAEYYNTSTITNLGSNVFGNLNLSNVLRVTQNGLSSINISQITKIINSIVSSSISRVFSSVEISKIASDLLVNLGKGLSNIASSITGIKDAQAEENINAIVARLIEMMDALEIQEGLTAMVGLINAELPIKIAGVVGVGVTDIINIGTKIGTKTLTIRDVTKTLSNFIDGAVTILDDSSVEAVINYIDGKVVTLDNAILGLNGIITILDAYSQNIAVSSMGEGLQITQEVAQAASVLLKVAVNVLSQQGVYSFITNIDNNLITLDNAKTILTGVSNLLQVNSPLGALAIVTNVYKEILSGISVNELVKSLANAFAGMIIKGDYTDGNIGNLLNQSDILKPIMDVYGEQLSQVDVDVLLQKLLDSIGVEGLTGEMVVDTVGGVLNTATSIATNKVLLVFIKNVNYDAILNGDISGIISSVKSFVEQVLLSGKLGDILPDLNLPDGTINSALGLLETLKNSLFETKMLEGLLTTVGEVFIPAAYNNIIQPLGSLLLAYIVSAGENIIKQDSSTSGILSSDVVNGFLDNISSLTVSEILPGIKLDGDFEKVDIGTLFEKSEGVTALINALSPMITESGKAILDVIASISKETSNVTA